MKRLPSPRRVDHSIAEWRGAAELAERIGAHVADGEREEAELELDEHEQQALPTATDEVIAAAEEPPDDLVAGSRSIAP